MSPRALVVAHRTCPLDAPENSLAGIARAAELGADAVELDVRLTKDGVPVLLHDRSLLRTAWRPRRVGSITATRFTAACHHGTGIGLPTLHDALVALPAQVGVALDCKDDHAFAAAAAVVRDLAVGSRTMAWVRSAALVEVAHELLPEAQVALLRDTDDEASTLRYVRDARSCGASQVSMHQRQVSRRIVDEAELLGVTVFGWVVRRDAHEAVLAAGVHGLVTDWPATARALVG